jgi:hypothetical protein
MNRPSRLSDIPSSIREQIVAAAVSALALTGLTIVRDRLHPVEQESLPMIGVFSEDAPPMGIGEQYRSDLEERVLLLHFEARAVAVVNDQEIATTLALDPLLTWINYALRHDTHFAGPVDGRLVNDIFEKETSPYSREADKPIASVSRTFTVKYRTSRLDPTSKG